jgi:O-6-methylguanine DNA methyltransferase
LDRIVQFLNGAKDNFADVPISLEHLSPFQRRVVAACRAIPRGGTKSYGLLAAAAGSPGAARAVGQVMATNRYPILVPCHRVVAAGGRLGGFSAPQGLSLKRQLLAFEASVADNEFRLSPARPPRKAARP